MGAPHLEPLCHWQPIVRLTVHKFLRLEKEAHVNGVPIGQSIGIDIPPPRPKRKPSNPYPRKSSSAASTCATLHVGAKVGKLLSSVSSSRYKQVVDLEKEPLHERPFGEEKANNAENLVANCAEVFTLPQDDHCTSVSSANNNSIPSQVALGNACTFRDATNESHVTIKLKGNQNLKKIDAKMIVGDTGTSGAPKSGNTNNAFQKELVQGEKFSSITVSSLLQNPAAHSAASSTAAFWPYANAKNREDPPSMAAIAAATVTAATAWWAVHRLLPVQTDFSCSPISMTGVPVPSMDTGQAPPAKRERGESSLQIPSLQDQQLDSKHTEAVEAQHSNIAKANTDNEKDVASTEEVHDSNHAKSRKQVDRSSYGSNTPSDSEDETAAIEKNEKGKEELKEPNTSHPAAESSQRRSRCVSNMYDSWKEVSEEGRLAFHALFSRDVLPQSFSLTQDLKIKGHQNDGMED
ncbi:protein LHY isoform X2 [Prunus yedoensis var. nudiflora]|uniref:Protein LHY isoform X2 n=1 Tax=Prunus yedoensis var. nudiflora TaxID=2094558 RepID=A0A314YCS9_PRUYE|nr:protein LHY isoform X2 [Prunus yedoensis var. nudiflora]